MQPDHKILFHHGKRDTIERYYYSNFRVLTHQINKEDVVENHINYMYANNTLTSILDSLFIEDEFVSVMKYEMYYDSLRFPYQILMKEQLKNNNEELLEIYTLEIDR